MTSPPRVAMALGACIGALTLVTSTSAVSSVSPPPLCTTTDTLREATLTTGPVRRGYARFCGPGKALVRADGKAFTIDGGHCGKANKVRWVAFGLLGTGRKPPTGFGISLVVRPGDQPGRVSVLDAIVQVDGQTVEASGRAVVSEGLAGARFSIVTGEASPTRISGSWVCER